MKPALHDTQISALSFAQLGQVAAVPLAHVHTGALLHLMAGTLNIEIGIGKYSFPPTFSPTRSPSLPLPSFINALM